ncbi:hypothetical protein AX16_003303 [Volvariella volvacea WC 439]|nr:hypothetical protein AX16_003303 [Volvariella volvacea WC 439]
MSLTWSQRKSRLAALLKSQGDENADGLALDRLLHGHRVIGKTARTTEIESLRFQDKDLNVVGTLEYGQFGVIDVVTCVHDGRAYVRKTIDKVFAMRTRDQCSPQFERDILLQARETKSLWAPHLLCAFQSTTHLHLIMDYAEGGNLWDVLESSPHESRIAESDVKWWAPQIVGAIHWCHSQGFVHRDIKPHNFVLKSDARILLIDFGSAAPLLPSEADGSQCIPKRYCLVPCGTCDYVSPEVLIAHEEALVALEMADDDEEELNDSRMKYGTKGYGLETDWWSLGAMLYEMVYGIAPFFANDIRQTYMKIIDHQRSLRFSSEVSVSRECQDLIQRLLTTAETRLGRCDIAEITDHPFFDYVPWDTLTELQPPPDLHLPQFTYNDDNYDNIGIGNGPPELNESFSQGFAFSALFNSSKGTNSLANSLRQSIARSPPQGQPQSQPQILLPLNQSQNVSSSLSMSNIQLQQDQNDLTSPFIGFSWGPTLDAFEMGQEEESIALDQTQNDEFSRINYRRGHVSMGSPNPFNPTTPRNPLRLSSFHITPKPLLHPASFGSLNFGTTLGLGDSNGAQSQMFSTPMRPTSLYPNGTVNRTITSTVRRTGGKGRRTVSDREAMRQLVDCVGMSARKKVLESGRKPRILDSLVKVRATYKPGNGAANGAYDNAGPSSGAGAGGGFRKELRFLSDPIPVPDWTSTSAHGRARSTSSSHSFSMSLQGDDTRSSGGYGYPNQPTAADGQTATAPAGFDMEQFSELYSDDISSSSAPPSPSPSPRPGSAMSMMSRRSGTPTLTLTGTGTFSRRLSKTGSSATLGRTPPASASAHSVPATVSGGSRPGVYSNGNGNLNGSGENRSTGTGSSSRRQQSSESRSHSEWGGIADESETSRSLRYQNGTTVPSSSDITQETGIDEPLPTRSEPVLPRHHNSSQPQTQAPQRSRQQVRSRRDEDMEGLHDYYRRGREQESGNQRHRLGTTSNIPPVAPEARGTMVHGKEWVLSFDELEGRYERLMADITNIEEKLIRAMRRFG